ncbi:MAG: hypothetical protein EXS35_07890 [Pedosphaera sp.]|nr:hypothetical protein [Pedosphaera sp.]
MARNRKYQPAGIRFGPALKAVLLCLLFAGSGVGYVWQKTQIYELGKQIRQRELHLVELRESNKKLSNRLAELRSPLKLEQRARELNLGLVQAQPAQIWRLTEPADPTVSRPAAISQLAARQTAGPRMR